MRQPRKRAGLGVSERSRERHRLARRRERWASSSTSAGGSVPSSKCNSRVSPSPATTMAYDITSGIRPESAGDAAGRARQCSRITCDENGGNEMTSGREGGDEFVVADGDPEEFVELVEKALDAVAESVASWIQRQSATACGQVGMTAWIPSSASRRRTRPHRGQVQEQIPRAFQKGLS